MRILTASDTFALRRSVRPRYPIVLDGTGRVVLAIDEYLRHGLLRRNRSPGTLRDEAYILKAWWSWAHRRGREGKTITSAVIAEWHGEQLSWARIRPGDRNAKSVARLDRCLEVIQDFNSYLVSRPRFEVELRSQLSRAHYVNRLSISDVEDPLRRVRYTTVPQRSGPGRPTPTPAEAERVLEQLASVPSSWLAERNYLIGAWMSEVGLRAGGVVSLTCSSLTLALHEYGLHASLSVQTAADEVGQQAAILQFLHDRLGLGQTSLYPRVIEKGGVERVVLAPITLIDASLRHRWSTTAVPGVDAVFLSRKTGQALTPGAIADIVKRAFRNSAVRGSGHRLRAAYAERIVSRLYEEGRARHGIMLDDHQVLINAAELLGHRDWRSLRHYLNNAKRNAIILENWSAL